MQLQPTPCLLPHLSLLTQHRPQHRPQQPTQPQSQSILHQWPLTLHRSQPILLPPTQQYQWQTHQQQTHQPPNHPAAQ
jgi:hypothetical protein